MKTIWKFPLKLKKSQTIQMPQEAKILTAQLQQDAIYLWALVDSDNPLEGYNIVIEGTGHPINEVDLKYINTIQIDNGKFIFHIFEA